jgi:hypothetical protein
MANFSFDYGNAHWTVLDANTYMDWSNPSLREWLVKDLTAARSVTWRVVAFHQPGFNSSKEHFAEQYMRWLSPIFEANNVDVVFSGHVHNYQRSFPLKFVPRRNPTADRSREVAGGGGWTTRSATVRQRAHGVITLSAGPAALLSTTDNRPIRRWQPFTHKFFAAEFFVLSIDGKTTGAAFHWKSWIRLGSRQVGRPGFHGGSEGNSGWLNMMDFSSISGYFPRLRPDCRRFYAYDSLGAVLRSIHRLER